MFIDGRIVTAHPRERMSPGPYGVRKYVKEKCFWGYTLFSPAFGNTEYLIDMLGLVVHKWQCSHSQLAELLPNGNLMVDDYGFGLQELKPDGTKVWEWKGDYHHDFYPLPNGNVVMLTSVKEPVRPNFYIKGVEPDHMQTDVVIEVDRSGKILWQFNFADHIEEIAHHSGLPLPIPYAARTPDGEYKPRGLADWAHTNTIEVLPDTPLGRKDPRFRAGNLLFSFRALDIIGIIDREKEEVVWAWGLGVLDGQHQPTMIPNGNILIFDNGTYRGYSAAVEIDPAKGEIVWKYESPEDFFSPFRSGVQRLPNGNTLICESDAGRIFEVTPDKEVVWDYYSPFFGQGEQTQGRHVYRATRYTEEYVEPLFASRKDKIVAVGDEEGNRYSTFREALKFYQKGFGA